MSKEKKMQGVKKRHPVQFRVTDNQFKRWYDTASDFDLSISEFIRQVVDTWIYAKDTQEMQGKTVTLQGRVSHHNDSQKFGHS